MTQNLKLGLSKSLEGWSGKEGGRDGLKKKKDKFA